MFLFKKKKNVEPDVFELITFAGTETDIVWMRDASSVKNGWVVAEPPFEVAHVQNGAIVGQYNRQKAEFHGTPGSDINKLYFVNMKMPCVGEWGTREKYEYKDPYTGRVVEIGANGLMSFCVYDSKRFIETVLGSKTTLSAAELMNIMLPKMFDEFGEHFISSILDEKISYEKLDLKMKEIGTRLLPKINFSFTKYGINIEEFIIKHIVKPTVLKDRTNEHISSAEAFDDITIENQQKLALARQREELEAQEMKMAKARTAHSQDALRGNAQLDKEIEKMNYETKGVTYKELRKLDVEDAEVAADIISKANPQTNITIVQNSEEKGLCPHCGAEVKAKQIFCPACRRKIG